MRPHIQGTNRTVHCILLFMDCEKKELILNTFSLLVFFCIASTVQYNTVYIGGVT
jgi:hypothetical protein